MEECGLHEQKDACQNQVKILYVGCSNALVDVHKEPSMQIIAVTKLEMNFNQRQKLTAP